MISALASSWVAIRAAAKMIDPPERRRLASPRSLADVGVALPFERTQAHRRLEAALALSPRSPVIARCGLAWHHSQAESENLFTPDPKYATTEFLPVRPLASDYMARSWMSYRRVSTEDGEDGYSGSPPTKADRSSRRLLLMIIVVETIALFWAMFTRTSHNTRTWPSLVYCKHPR